MKFEKPKRTRLPPLEHIRQIGHVKGLYYKLKQTRVLFSKKRQKRKCFFSLFD